MMPRLKELYFKEIQTSLKEKFGFKNFYMSPQISKVVINMGLGLDGNDSKIVKSCEDDLAKLAGQKDCGCGKRQDALNKKFSYNPKGSWLSQRFR